MSIDIIVIGTIGIIGGIVLVGTWIWASRESKRIDKLK